LTDDESQREGDQPVVEEIEHVAQHRSGNDLPLVRRQLLLALQNLQHGILPRFFYAPVGAATLRAL